MVSEMEANRISSFSDRQKVWEEYKQTKALELRNKLVEFYLPLVVYNAKRIKVRLPREIELDDLISAGVFGLMDAIEAFDLSRGVKFETYCVPRIRGAILDELRKMDWVPRLVRSQVIKYHRVEEAFSSHNGNDHFTAKEIAEHLGVSLEDAEKIESVGNTPVTHFCRMMPMPRGDTVTDNGTVDSNQFADCKSLRAEEEFFKDTGFQELISCLSDIEQIIVTLYHRDEYQLWKIGKILGFSEARMSQMHSNALQKIKDSLVL